MRSVFSIDSEGIVNACTKNVTTNTAITTVPATDCTVAGQSLVEKFSLQDIIDSAERRATSHPRLQRLETTRPSRPARAAIPSRWQDIPAPASPLPARLAFLSVLVLAPGTYPGLVPAALLQR